MLKKILVVLGILLLGVSTAVGGFFVGRENSVYFSKISNVSNCVHIADANMLRFMISGGELVEDAKNAVEAINACWSFSHGLTNFFSQKSDKLLKSEQLHALIKGYGDLVMVILEREREINILLNMMVREDTPKHRVNMSRLMISSLMGEQITDVARTKTFLRSVDSKLIELLE